MSQEVGNGPVRGMESVITQAVHGSVMQRCSSLAEEPIVSKRVAGDCDISVLSHEKPGIYANAHFLIEEEETKPLVSNGF